MIRRLQKQEDLWEIRVPGSFSRSAQTDRSRCVYSGCVTTYTHTHTSLGEKKRLTDQGVLMYVHGHTCTFILARATAGTTRPCPAARACVFARC